MSNTKQQTGANFVVLSTRVANILAKNNISLEQAEKMTIDEWNVLVNISGNGIGVATVLEVQQYFSVTEPAVEKLSAADKRGEQQLVDKVSTVVDILNVFGKKHGTKEVMVMIDNNSATKKMNNVNLAEHVWARFLLMEKDEQVRLLSPMFRIIYMNQVNSGDKTIILNALLSQQGNMVESIVKNNIVKDFKMKRSFSSYISDNGPSRYALFSQLVITVLIDVLDLLNIVKVTNGITDQGLQIKKLVIKSKEAVLTSEDKNLWKLLTKECGTTMKPFYQEWKDSTKLPSGTRLYSGHRMKYNPGIQPSHVLKTLNMAQRTGYIIPRQFWEINNPEYRTMAMAVRKLIAKYFKYDPNSLKRNAPYEAMIDFMDNYKGEVFYPTISLTVDNGRNNYNDFPFGFHVGGLAWLAQLAEQSMLTEENVAKYKAKIESLDAKLKLKTKEEFERLHYLCAIDQYHKGEPSGAMISKDFKGSGPLCQAIIMKDVDGLKMCIDTVGQKASDPYMNIIDRLVTLNGLEDREQLVLYYLDILKESDKNAKLDLATVRNWVKFHVQPMQYGSGSKTSEKNARGEGSIIEQEQFEKAFELGLPHTWKMLETLKSWVKLYNKEAKSLIIRMEDFTKCSYTTAFGTKCMFTPLSKDFVNKFSIMGHTMNVPCKIIDKDEWGVGAIAAGSHQLDSSILMMIQMLFGRNMYTIHDDFRVSINEEERLERIATQVLKYFWLRDDLLDSYISQVFGAVLPDFSKYRAGVERKQIPDFDWNSVTQVLF